MNYLKTITLAIASIAIAACSSQKEEMSQDSGYSSPGKPSASIELDYTLANERVTVGETVELKVSFKSAENGVISANFSTNPEMVLNGDKHLSLNIKKGHTQTNQHQFSVTPSSEGIHYINILASEEGKVASKPFAIRIIAGDKSIEEYLQSNGTLTEDADGEKIISMTAEEDEK